MRTNKAHLSRIAVIMTLGRTFRHLWILPLALTTSTKIIAQTPPNITGHWSITTQSAVFVTNGLGTPAEAFLTGDITQTGAAFSGDFGIVGSPCGTGGTLSGTISSSGQLNATLTYGNFSMQTVTFTGTASSGGTVASGTYTTPATGCTNGDYGTWSTAKQRVTNGATFLDGPVAPGSIITLFGYNLGPYSGAASPPYPTTLGGASVTFNGFAAPLLYINPNLMPSQINAQIPFEVAGGNTAILQVYNSGLPVQSVQVQIAPVSPGIFLIGQFAALFNTADYALAAPVGAIVNLASHPINRGEQALMYVTGLGAVAPPIPNGITDLETIHTAVSTPVVWIGGITDGVKASVTFAGQARNFPE
jgi:uncharacterized protein (TIGR03437 family)